MEFWVFDKHKKMVAKRIDSTIYLLNEKGECSNYAKAEIIRNECYIVLHNQPKLTVLYPPIGALNLFSLLDPKRRPVAYMQLVQDGAAASLDLSQLMHAEIENFYGGWSAQDFHSWFTNK